MVAVPPGVEAVSRSQVSSGLRCCSLFFRLSNLMSGRWRRWLASAAAAEQRAPPVGVRQTHSEPLLASPPSAHPPIAQGIMVSKACPTPAAAGRMAQWKVMGGPTEMQGGSERERKRKRVRDREKEREREGC